MIALASALAAIFPALVVAFMSKLGICPKEACSDEQSLLITALSLAAGAGSFLAFRAFLARTAAAAAQLPRRTLAAWSVPALILAGGVGFMALAPEWEKHEDKRCDAILVNRMHAETRRMAEDCLSRGLPHALLRDGTSGLVWAGECGGREPRDRDSVDLRRCAARIPR